MDDGRQEQIEQEDALWPWLADDSMADGEYEDFAEPREEVPDEYCDDANGQIHGIGWWLSERPEPPDYQDLARRLLHVLNYYRHQWSDGTTALAAEARAVLDR